MNVLYFLKNYPKLSESWVREEVAELQRRGHRVAVYSVDAPDSLTDGPAVRHHRQPPFSLDTLRSLESRDLLHPAYLDTPIGSSNPARQAFVHYHAAAARGFVASLPFDVDHVHGHFGVSVQVAAQYLARSLGATHSVTTHAHDLYGPSDAQVRQYLYRHCDRLVTISEYNASVMEQESEVPLDVDVIPACIDVDAYTPRVDTVPNRVVTVARHVEKKGLWYALHAVARLDVPVEYHVLSDGPLTDSLRALAADLDIEDRVTFLGRVSDQRLREELDAASVFLLPCVVAQDGDRDGLPVALKEAMAMGTVPVTTYVSGIPELVDESCGYLVPPRNVPALAEALGSALDGRPDGRGERARTRVETHDVEPVVDSLVEVFEDAATTRSLAAHSESSPR